MNRHWGHIALIGWLALGLTLSACGGEKESKPMENAPQINADGVGQVAAFEEGSATRVAPPSERMQMAQARVEGSDSDVDGHPTVDPNQHTIQRKVLVPASVEGKWKAVKLMIRNKKDEEQSRMQTVDLGTSFPLEGSPLTVTVGPFLPNFVMDMDSFTSNGNELVNPAVHLLVKEGDKTVFDGWAFAKFPGMYAFEHDTFSLQLMDFIPIQTS